MSAFDTITARLAVCDSESTLNALGRCLAAQFAANGDDDALFRLQLAMTERRAALRKTQPTPR